VRQARAGPDLKSLHEWLHKTATTLSRKSELAKAIRYALSNWVALTRYCEDGRLEIDNNAAERALRAVALGRNYVRPVIMHGAMMVQRIWAVFSLHFLFPTEPCRA
jgi:transposase